MGQCRKLYLIPTLAYTHARLEQPCLMQYTEVKICLFPSSDFIRIGSQSGQKFIHMAIYLYAFQPHIAITGSISHHGLRIHLLQTDESRNHSRDGADGRLLVDCCCYIFESIFIQVNIILPELMVLARIEFLILRGDQIWADS